MALHVAAHVMAKRSEVNVALIDFSGVSSDHPDPLDAAIAMGRNLPRRGADDPANAYRGTARSTLFVPFPCNHPCRVVRKTILLACPHVLVFCGTVKWMHSLQLHMLRIWLVVKNERMNR